MRLTDKVSIITGAGQGIGRATALKFSSEGAKVAVCDINQAAVDDTVRAILDDGGEAAGFKVDVTDKESIARMVSGVMGKWGRIDTLINNAGISMHARFDELHDIDAVERITAINYFGSVYCTWYALPYLKKTKGRLVAISSLTGRHGVPTRTLYSGTKHAMAGFFDSLRIELKNEGVSVTVIYPGFVATDIAERALGPDGKPLGTRPVNKNAIMSVEECARQTVQAVAARKREVIMTRRARLGMLLKAIWPDIVDRFAESGIKRGR